MDPLAPSRQERRKAATRGAILDAAESIALRLGVEELRVEDVAREADVGVGTVYFHFASRRGVVLAVIDRCMTLYEESQRAALESDAPPWRRVELAGEAMYGFFVEHPDRYRLLAFPAYLESGADAETEPALVELADRGDALVDLLRDAVAAAIEAGDFRDLDPDRTAKFLWGAWSGVLALHLRPDRLRLPEDEVAEVLAEGREIVTGGVRLLRIPEPKAEPKTTSARG